MTAGAAPFTLADLERALSAADPAALLVPPRILRRVIKKDSGLAGVGLQVPHRKSYVIGRDALLAIADRADIGIKADRELPETPLLFPAPDPRKLRRLPPEATLLKYWRLLFHARVHQAVARSLPPGPQGEAAIRERIRRIGQAETDEIRTVLRQENFLLHPYKLRSVYEEFVAVFLELLCFAPHRLPFYFPAIRDLAAVFRVLDADIDAAGLFAATRLAGAPDPTPASPQVEEGEAHAEALEQPRPTRPDPAAYARLTKAAAAAAERRNVVRAAILLEKAARAAPSPLSPSDGERGEGAAPARLASSEAIVRLAARLQAALGLAEAEAAVWRRGLGLLLGPAASGLWPREGRLLYDLQRV
ncbi:MAG TPA: hypothetical protein VMS17_32105, partial [Gemmataceae bacterium]|nr:hypothetical protein [Gemmataceae bacterium]